MSGLIYDHAPWPGPGYWDWRCRTCSEPVDAHAGVFARWRWRRLRYRLSMSTGVDSVDKRAHTRGMTQTSKREVPSTEVTAEMLATDRDFVAVTPSGQRIGDMPDLSFGLGSWDGDTEGFAAWLREQP